VMSTDDDPVMLALSSASAGGTSLEAAGLALEMTGVVTLADPMDVDLGDEVATVLPLRTRLADGGIVVALFSADQHRRRDLDDQDLLTSFTDQAALTLDRVRAVADRENHAVTEDRERIARDLHDVVIQRLFATGMQLRAAALRDGVELPARVEESVRDLDTTIRDVRSTIFGLRNGLPTSVRREVMSLSQQYGESLGFTPVVRATGPVDSVVDEELHREVMAVLREALSNVVRHARATRVEIELYAGQDELLLSVLDDGVGMGPVHHHSGLGNARERANARGGTLELSARVPHGLLFRWRVPLVLPAP
jgi:signal transduction histidine kinase